MNDKKILQQEELKILKYIKEVCEKNNIRYYMQGGTFLGAIRHQGFIPWDDDADIGIPRADFDKFVKIVKNDVNSDFYILTYEDDESDSNFVCKVHSKNIIVKETNYENERRYGIWVDIFPLDGLPNGKLKFLIHKFRLLFRRATWKISEGGKNININANRKSLFDKVVIFLGVKLKLGHLYKKKTQMHKINKLLKKYDFDSSNIVVNFMGAYKFREAFSKSIYDKSCLYKFEDTLLPGPENYDLYLSQMYGDYMTPLNDGEREVHTLEIVNSKDR